MRGDRDKFLGMDAAALEASLSSIFCADAGASVGAAFASATRPALDLDGDGEVSCEEYTGPAAYEWTTVTVRPACAVAPAHEAEFALPAAGAAADAAASAAALGWALLWGA